MTVIEWFMSRRAGSGSVLIHRPGTGDAAAVDFNVQARWPSTAIGF